MVVSAVDFVCSICRYGNRPLRSFGTVGMFLARCVADHLQGSEFINLLGGQELPVGWIGMLPIQDGLKMEMATRGRTCGTNPCNDFPYLDRFSLFDCYCLKVVVRGDEAVAVIDFHPVAATPQVPAHRPDDTGIGGIDPCAAWSSKILPPMKFAGGAGHRAGAETEWRARNQNLQRSHEGTGRRAPHIFDSNVQFMLAVFGRCPDNGAAEGNKGGRICSEPDGIMNARTLCGTRGAWSDARRRCAGMRRRRHRILASGTLDAEGQTCEGNGYSCAQDTDSKGARAVGTAARPGCCGVISHSRTPKRLGPPTPTCGLTNQWDHRAWTL